MHSLIETLSTLQTTFHNIRQQENQSDALVQLKVRILNIESKLVEHCYFRILKLNEMILKKKFVEYRIQMNKLYLKLLLKVVNILN